MSRAHAEINLDGLAPTTERVSLRALWVMMTRWGSRAERAENYRAFMRPRWPSATVVIDHIAE